VVVILKPSLVRFLSDKAQVERIRASFAGLWGLEHEEEVKGIIEMVKERPTDFVLKPQREGGGNAVANSNRHGRLTPPLQRKQHLWRGGLEESLDDGLQDERGLHPDGEDQAQVVPGSASADVSSL